MILPKTGVKRPVFTVMIFSGLLIFGIIAYLMLPKDMLPQIEIPTLTVVTLYPGASASDVETQVTRPLEEILAGVTNLRNIFSQSKENVSTITLQFDWNTNLEEASGTVRDYLEFTRRSLPDQASSPMLMRIDSDMFPVIIYGVSATDSGDELGQILDDYVANALKRVSGVGALVIMGEPEKEVRISTGPNALQAYGLSLEQVARSLKARNTTIPGGSMVIGYDEMAVSIPARFSGIEDIEQTPVSAWQGQTVRVRDVGDVELGLKDPKEVVRIFGETAVAIFVQKQAGANIMDVVKGVRKEMETVKPLLPDDVQVFELMDNSEMVTATLHNLFYTIMYAGIFVVLVVITFLRKFRSSLIIVLTIPFSLIVAFIFMYLAGFTVNIFSLMSLAVAIGMVIDNAIVVLENISRQMERGVPPVQAAILGTREMGMAIVAATLTTIAVFVPLVFMQGVVGIMFRQLAVITAVTLLASLFTALMLTPMLASRLLINKERSNESRFFLWSEKVFASLERKYAALLLRALHGRLWVILIAVLLFAGSLWLARSLGTDYIPEFDAGDLSAVVETRIGASTEETLRLTQQLEEIFREEVPGLRNLYSLTGQSDEGLLASVGFSEGKNITTIFARTVLPEEREERVDVLVDRLRARIGRVPGVENFSVTGGSLINDAVMGNIRPIQITLSGFHLETLNQTARMLEDTLRTMAFLTNVESTVDRGKPGLQVKVDTDKAAVLGLNQALAGYQVRQSIYGQQAGEMDVGQGQVPVNIRYHLRYRNHETSLEDVLLTGINGQQIRLGQVARIEESIEPLEIKRENQQRVVYVYAEPYRMALGQAADMVSELLEKAAIPADVRVEIAGQVKEQRESFGNLYYMLGIGFLLVFMVMASQFESLRHPFVIIFTIPFSITGVIIALWLAGLSISVVTLLGLIMLLGIVVNNGIVLVDYTNLLRQRGLPLTEAVMEAGKSRLRPVLMTSFTTILGMVPMTLSKGIGSEMWSPLATAIIGGLLISTLVTLVLVPVVYLLMNKRRTSVS